VVVFPDIYRRYSGRLTEGDVVLISGKRDEDNLIARQLVPLQAPPIVVEFSGKGNKELKKIRTVIQEAQGGRVPLILAGKTGKGGRQILLLPAEIWPVEEKRDYFVEEFKKKGFKVEDFS